MKHVAGIILLLLSISTFSQFDGDSDTRTDMQRDAGKIECRNEVSRCTYSTQHLTARTLVSRIEAVLKPGDIITPKEGYVSVEGLKVISYWFYNEELKTRFEALLPLLDVLEDGVPSHLVQLTTEIYSLSDRGLKSIDASISSAGGDAQDGPDWDFSDLGGILDMNLNVGTKLLSMLLSGSVTRSESSQVTKVVQLIPNFAGVNYKRTTKIYISPTAGSVKEEEAGLTIGGTVSINARDNNLVTIKDYNIKYGVLKPGLDDSDNDQVTILNVSNPQLYLYKDVNTMIVSSQTSTTMNDRGFRFFGFGASKSKTFSKLMVVTRAKAIKFDDYRKEMKKYADLDLFKTFSETQVDNMPAKNSNIEAVLNSLKPYTYMTTSGRRLVGFRLDPKFAAKDNIKRNFDISIRGGGIKMKKTRSVENLMLSGFKFDEFSERYLSKSRFKIKIKLKEFNGTGSYSQKFYYDPERNVFIK